MTQMSVSQPFGTSKKVGTLRSPITSPQFRELWRPAESRSSQMASLPQAKASRYVLKFDKFVA